MKTTTIVSAVLMLTAATAYAAPDAKKGETSYKQFCVTCHGEKGDGNGPAAASLTPKPTNFSDKAKMKTVTDAGMFDMIKKGGAAMNRSPLMAPWGGVLKDEDIQNVVAFLRTFSADKK